MSIVTAGVDTDKLDIKPINRPIFPPVPTALPQKIPSTELISCPLINSLINCAPNISGLVFLYWPFNTPIGLLSPP